MTDETPEPIAASEIYFAASTNAFYDLSVWTAPLPNDAVLVSAEEHAAIQAAEVAGLRRAADADGRPIAVPSPPPTTEEQAAQVRRDRDFRIGEIRWLVERHRDELALQIDTTLTPEDYRLVQEYVQSLRDVPEQDGFPAAVVWPALDQSLLATGA